MVHVKSKNAAVRVMTHHEHQFFISLPTSFTNIYLIQLLTLFSSYTATSYPWISVGQIFLCIQKSNNWMHLTIGEFGNQHNILQCNVNKQNTNTDLKCIGDVGRTCKAHLILKLAWSVACVVTMYKQFLLKNYPYIYNLVDTSIAYQTLLPNLAIYFIIFQNWLSF